MKIQRQGLQMAPGTRVRLAILLAMILGCASGLLAQQKGQYVPGQYGLNAGIAPDPGFTFASLTINYSAGIPEKFLRELGGWGHGNLWVLGG
jgi:hypothetical protein